jgi:hypothetical protein
MGEERECCSNGYSVLYIHKGMEQKSFVTAPQRGKESVGVHTSAMIWKEHSSGEQHNAAFRAKLCLDNAGKKLYTARNATGALPKKKNSSSSSSSSGPEQ